MTITTQGGGEHEHVFGARKKAAPYQQRGGTRENITVIVTICADGTSTPPAVIFKGNAYQVKWGIIQVIPLMHHMYISYD